MKRALLLILLLSVGLNIGLGFALKRSGDRVDTTAGSGWEAGRPFNRPDSLRHGSGLGFGPPPHGRERWRRMRDMHTRMSPELVEKRAILIEARLALREALRRDDVDDAEIMGLVGAMVAAQGRIDSLVASNLLEELQRMTPEERDEMLQRMPWVREPQPRRGVGKPSVSP